MADNYSYSSLRKYIKVLGQHSTPDGKPCLEKLVVHSQFMMGEVVGREKMNLKLGFMEGLQLVAGTDDKKAILAVAPKVDIDMFTGMSFYGPRVRGQIPVVLAELRRDILSRRAVLTVANDPEHDIPNNTEPCTTAIQFLVRYGMLNLVAYMRSSDVVWGVPYDVMQFSMLGLAVALALEVKPGFVHLVGGSVHEYTSTSHIQATGSTRYFGLSLLTNEFSMSTMERWSTIREWALRNVLFPDTWVANGMPAGVSISSGRYTGG